MSDKCGCSDDWKCPEHRGIKIPVKSGNQKKLLISPYWKGFLEASCIFGVILLILKIMENWK